MEMMLCLAERFCRCGSELMIEYMGETNADSAIAQMFDELHHGPDCGPVSPQMAAIARSKMTHRELHARRRPAKETVDDRETGEPMFDRDYEFLFPDYHGGRDSVIAAVLTALAVPHGTRLRARDAWFELADDGACLRLLCKIGGPHRDVYKEGVAALRALPGYIRDSDEEFNPAYASFYFKLPESIPVETRAELATNAIQPRDLVAEAETARDQFVGAGIPG